MKHFIGGFSVGFLVGMLGIDICEVDIIYDIAACVFIGVLVGLCAWGLLP